MNQNVLFSPFPLDSSTDFIHRDSGLFLKKLRKRGQKDRCHRRWFPFWSPFLAMFTKTKRYHSCTAFNTVKNSYGGDRLKFIDLWYNAVRACQVSPLDCCDNVFHIHLKIPSHLWSHISFPSHVYSKHLTWLHSSYFDSI